MRADRITDVQNQTVSSTPKLLSKNIDGSQKSSTRFDDCRFYSNLQSQLLESAAGTVSQIRECSGELIKFAKERKNIPVILVGHITKDGQIAGPKVLEHMVDVVLNFDGDRNHLFRLLRAQKNRFGSTQRNWNL